MAAHGATLGRVVKSSRGGRGGVVAVLEKKKISLHQVDLQALPADSVSQLVPGRLVELRLDAAGVVGIAPATTAVPSPAVIVARQPGGWFLRLGGFFRIWGKKYSRQKVPEQTYLHPAADLQGADAPQLRDTMVCTDCATPAPACLPADWVRNKAPQFAFVPDLSCLQAGDLILVEACFVSEAALASIQWVQVAQEWHGYHWVHARWHHAAVYLGDGKICEANHGQERVMVRSLSDYTGTHRIRARRVRALAADKQAMIAEAARSLAGCEYHEAVLWLQGATAMGIAVKRTAIDVARTLRAAVAAAVSAVIAVLRMLMAGGPEADRANGGRVKVTSAPPVQYSFTCSSLYAEAYRLATSTSLRGHRITPWKIMPASLSVSAQFDDVQLDWQQWPQAVVVEIVKPA